MAEPPDAPLVAESTRQRLADHDAHILSRVMEIDIQIALRSHGKIEYAVPRQRGQHMVQKSNAGVDLAPAAAVEVERNGDVGLGRGPGQSCIA